MYDKNLELYFFRYIEIEDESTSINVSSEAKKEVFWSKKSWKFQMCIIILSLNTKLEKITSSSHFSSFTYFQIVDSNSHCAKYRPLSKITLLY